MRPTVLLDVDGVICNFTKLYIRAAKRAGVLTNSFDENWHPSTWDIGDALELTADGRAAVHKSLCKEGAATYGIEAYEGAIDGVKAVMAIADVYFPTASFEMSPTWEHDRRIWFYEHISREASRRLIFTQHKHLICGDVFVDDKVENLTSWKSRWSGGDAIIWPHPYNEERPAGIARWGGHDWNALVTWLEESWCNQA